jgi:hypothetical protein
MTEKQCGRCHGRLLACAELGWTEVPTLCLDHLIPAQARAFRIANNRLTKSLRRDERNTNTVPQNGSCPSHRLHHRGQLDSC